MLKATLKVLLGLTLGLAFAELAFSLRDGGAFPHLNLYEADATLGVRLRPHAEMKLRVASNPVTSVRTNELGFRGADWPAPTPGEVLVVGDSQVFGLGVEEGETFSAQLAKQLGKPVLNAGVPTYGPREYTAVVEDVLRSRKVGTVIYVLNLSNDLFEVERANITRHAVWDGWAVRTETAPQDLRDFPFRRELMTRSHLVFALRKWLHQGSSASEGFTTEGGWRDVAKAGEGVTPLPPQDEQERRLLETRKGLADQLEQLATRLENHLSEKVGDDTRFADAVKPLVPKGGDPRDILEVRYAEGARRVDLTAYELFMAAVGEARNEAFLTALAQKQKDPELKQLLEERKKLRGELDALKPEGEAQHALPIETVLEQTKRACDAVGARLVVVALPLDVMVSAEEWKKYPGAKAIDMGPTHVLVDDLVARADRLGALGVDPTAALLAAEPGAFLQEDLHLTPKGHVALATHLVAAMNAPPKQQPTALALPPGRSWPPTDDEWRREKECNVKGSSAAFCETKLVREWLRVVCRAQEKDEGEEPPPDLLEVRAGGHGDVLRDGATLIIPVLPGDAARVRFAWSTTERELQLDFPRDGKLTMAFTEAVPRKKRRGEEYWHRDPPPGDPLAPPTCRAGEVVAGAMVRCAVPCDEQRACAAGHCEPWVSGGFCAP